MRYSARQIVGEIPIYTANVDRLWTGAITRRDSPATSAVTVESKRIVDRVALLHIGRAAAVLEVIGAFFFAHEGVLDAAKINPDMR